MRFARKAPPLGVLHHPRRVFFRKSRCSRSSFLINRAESLGASPLQALRLRNPSRGGGECGKSGCGCQNRFGIPFWGRCTTHFRTYFSGWIGMFTGGTIWPLTHGQVCAERAAPRLRVEWTVARLRRDSHCLSYRGNRIGDFDEAYRGFACRLAQASLRKQSQANVC